MESKTVNSPIMELRNISRFYKLGNIIIEAISDVTMNIYRENFLLIFGPSGSGKTTLLNILAGLDKPNKGNVILKLNGISKNLTEFKNRDLEYYRRYNVGIIFQFFNLIPILTVFENILLAAKLVNKSNEEAIEKTKKYLNMVELGEKQDKYPYQLSGGEQQRIAIARALVKETDIIFADEPTGNLDSIHSREIYALLKKINQEYHRAIIVVSHDYHLADEFANQKMKLIDGKISMVKNNGQ